jgi:hypothetical protein
MITDVDTDIHSDMEDVDMEDMDMEDTDMEDTDMEDMDTDIHINSKI